MPACGNEEGPPVQSDRWAFSVRSIPSVPRALFRVGSFSSGLKPWPSARGSERDHLPRPARAAEDHHVVRVPAEALDVAPDPQ